MRIRVAVLLALACLSTSCGHSTQSFLPSGGAGAFDALSRLGAHESSPRVLHVLWTPIGPTEPPPGMSHWWNPLWGTKKGGWNSGKTNATAVDPTNPSTMYIASGAGRGCEVTSDAGIYKTTDAGKSWTPADNGLGDNHVNDLWIDPAAPSWIVAATEMAGIYLSKDAGATWINGQANLTARQLLQVGSNLYAATSAGVLVSTNSGLTWKVSLAGKNPVNALAVGPNDAVFAGFSNLGVAMRSGGKWHTFGKIAFTSAFSSCANSGGIRGFAAAADGTVYASVNAIDTSKNTETAILFVTTDGGKSWQYLPAGATLRKKPGSQAIAIPPDRVNTLYDGGDSASALYANGAWKQLGTAPYYSVFGDTRRVYIAADNSVIVNSDQGVWSAKDLSGRGLVSLTAGLSTNVMQDISVYGSIVETTIQDFIGAQQLKPGGPWTYTVDEEDGSVLAGVGKNHNQCVLVNAVFYGYSTNGCVTWKQYDSKKWSREHGHLILDPVNPSIFYAIGVNGAVYRGSNVANFTKPTGWSVVASRMAIDPTNDQTIDVVTAGKKKGPPATIVRTTNGGKTWQPARLGIVKPGAPAVVAIDPGTPNIVVAACSGPYGTQIYRSIDGGVSYSYVSTPVQSNLRARGNDYAGMYADLIEHPEMRAFNSSAAFFATPEDLKFNPAPPKGQMPALVLATSQGGAISYDTGKTWFSINGDAISTEFYSIVWQNGIVYLATRGQGVLTAPLQ